MRAGPSRLLGAQALAGGVLGFLAATLPAQEPRSIPGFSPRAAQRQLDVEEQLVSLLDRERVGAHFRLLTEEPHPAGSLRNRELAEYVRDRFLEYGLKTEIVRYDVLLPLPERVAVTLVEPKRHAASLFEDGYPQDKDSYARDMGVAYMGMSGSASVTAPLVYAHSGNPEDYDWLLDQGIDARGKIALVRYSQPYSYRGFKAWEAERRGVAALLIYSDPMEDGYTRGEAFPDGPWGPESHIQRGAISYDFLEPGDPLTPGWASVEGAPRMARGEARSIPKIAAVPLSWRDARVLLESLGGPVAPYAWQGGLPLTYHVGPGPARVSVDVAMDGLVRPIWVVVGTLRGEEEPEKLVVLGNHRDAWVYGGVDPSSGTASLLELARVLGELARRGMRPRRSLVLASWDAEEIHLTGSTEWGEQFAERLGRDAIAYLNVDSSTSGPVFSVSAVASLDGSIEAVARDTIDPDDRRSLLEAHRRRGKASGEGEPAPLVENRLGSGSDYTVFLNFLGVPVADLTFEGPYGVYHSQYDDYYWMTRFGDPGFRYMTAMVEVWGRLALRLANAEVYPYDFAGYAVEVAGYLDELAAELAATPVAAKELDLAPARAAAGAWERAAAGLGAELERLLSLSSQPPHSDLAALNQQLLLVERQLLLPDGGIPERPWFKHSLYAPRYTYAAMTLPGVREAILAADWERARAELARLVERLRAAAAAVGAARDLAARVSTGPRDAR